MLRSTGICGGGEDLQQGRQYDVATDGPFLIDSVVGVIALISRTGATLFFQIMTRRYERASTVLTSNKGFEDWGEVFGDEVTAALMAMALRLVPSSIYQIFGRR